MKSKVTGKISLALLNDTAANIDEFFKRRGSESICNVKFYFQDTEIKEEYDGRIVFYEFDKE